MVDLKKNGKSVSVEPTLVRISDKLSLRYEMSGNGPPLVVLHTIRTLRNQKGLSHGKGCLHGGGEAATG